MFGINRVLDAFWVGMIFGAILTLYFYLSSIEVNGGPTRLARWIATIVMWSERRAARRAAGMQPVYIPVLETGIESAGIPDAADMDAEKPFDRDITAGEWIVRMACARNEEKKYRFSANQIHAAVGGDRNTVLAKIKEIRSGPPAPEFRQPDGTTAPATRPITSA